MNGDGTLLWRGRHVHAARAASAGRRAVLLATHRHADIRISQPVRIGPGFSLWLPAAGTLHIEQGCDFRRDFVCEIYEGGRVEIGAGTTFTYRNTVQISTSLVVGERCTFAEGVLIVDGNHRFRDSSRFISEQGYDYRPIEIGTGALVLAKATVTASIGAGAVVGANSVVTKPVPAYSLAVGAPARVVEYFGPKAAGTDHA